MGAVIDMAGQIFVNSMMINEKTSSSKLAVICLHLMHNHNHFDALTTLFLRYHNHFDALTILFLRYQNNFDALTILFLRYQNNFDALTILFQRFFSYQYSVVPSN